MQLKMEHFSGQDPQQEGSTQCTNQELATAQGLTSDVIPISTPWKLSEKPGHHLYNILFL